MLALFGSSMANLPIVQFEEQIVETVDRNPVVVIIGETGSGKSTQPEYPSLRFCTAEAKPSLESSVSLSLVKSLQFQSPGWVSGFYSVVH